MPYVYNHNLYKKLASASIFLSTLSLLTIYFAIVAQASPQQDISSQHIGIVSPALQGGSVSYVDTKIPINTLTNFEAFLNIVANFGEIVGLLLGLILLSHAVLFGKSKIIIPLLKIKLSRGNQFLVATTLILVGLAMPAMVNWLVASPGYRG